MERRDSARLTGAPGGTTATFAHRRPRADASAGFSPREGREFGLSVGTAFLTVGGLLWWRGHEAPAIAAGVVGASLIGAGLLISGRLGPLQRAWMSLAEAISRVTTPILMGVIYYVVLTPAGLLRRRLGTNPIRHSPEDRSYWARRPEDRRRSDLQRQF